MSNGKNRFFDMFQDTVQELGYDLIEVEWKKEGKRRVLRLYIDAMDGITLNDCETVSHAISDLLDTLDPIAEPYYLEVSSPGLERAMKTDVELKNAVGKDVILKFYAPIDGEKTAVGVLTGYDDDQITIRKEEEEKSFLRQHISTIRKYIQW